MMPVMIYTLQPKANTYEWLSLSPEPIETICERTEALEGQFRGQAVRRPFVYPTLRRDPSRAPRPLGDMPHWMTGVVLFSERAAEVLRPLIGHCGEFLPMNWAEGRLVAFNVCPLVDAIDFAACMVPREPQPKCWVAQLDPPLAFKPEAIEGRPIFKVPQFACTPFVNETFKRRCEEAGLEGIGFERVWPGPPEVKKWSELGLD